MKFVTILIIILIKCNYIDSICTTLISVDCLRCVDEPLNKGIDGYAQQKVTIKEYICTKCVGDEVKQEHLTYPNANVVRLYDNKIKKLNSNTLINMKMLKTLDLSENLITRIPNDFFVPCEMLTTFNISYNNLRNPNTDTFYKLNNIKILDVSYNRISTIDLGVLDEMTRLEEFYINNNALFALYLGIFDELPDLNIVDISYNEIKEIPLGLFDRSRKIKRINLSGNPFVSIKLGTYDNLKDLIDMKLTSCKISNLPLGIFDENKQLTNLDLSLNNIRMLTSNFFNNNVNLKYLNISHNVLNALPKKVFSKTVLEVLDVSYNNLEVITNNVLNLKTLKEIYLNDNDVYFLDSLTFSSIGYPHTHLDIRNNRLVFLDELIFEYLTNLETIEITGNPWDCRCLLELQVLLRKRFIEYTRDDYFDGTRPVCVAGEQRCQDTRNLDVDKLKVYYSIYVDMDLRKTPILKN